MKHLLKTVVMLALLTGLFNVPASDAVQSGCVTCHSDDEKMKNLVTFIPPLEGEGEG